MALDLRDGEEHAAVQTSSLFICQPSIPRADCLRKRRRYVCTNRFPTPSTRLKRLIAPTRWIWQTHRGWELPTVTLGSFAYVRSRYLAFSALWDSLARRASQATR